MATMPQIGVRRTPESSRAIATVNLSAEGNAIEGLGNTMLRDSTNRLEAIRAEAERVRKEAEHERKVEQRKIADAAERTAQITTFGAIENGLQDAQKLFQESISRGELPRDKVGEVWTDATQKLFEKHLPALPEHLRPELRARAEVLSGKLNRSLNDALVKRDEQVVSAGLLQHREQLERLATADPASAIQRWNQAVEGLGPKAGMTPEQMQKEKQSFMEGVQYTRAYSAVMASRGDNRALDAVAKALEGSDFASLDPQRRATLVTQIGAFQVSNIQKAEAAAARAEREQERRLKKAEAEFNVFQSMSDKGTIIDPAYAERVIQSTAGTPYQAGIRATLQQSQERAGIAAQPVPVQRAALDQINARIAKEGRTPELDKRKGQLEAILSGSVTDLAKDGLRAGLERGVITDLRPLDLTAGVPSAEQIQARVAQAERVSLWAGKAVSPFTPDEVDQLATKLSALPAKDRATQIASFATYMSAGQMREVAKQLGSKDDTLAAATILAAQGAKTSAGRLVSEIVLAGADAIKEQRLKWPSGQDQATVRAEIDKATRGAFLSESAQRAAGDAAFAAYAGLLAEKGSADVGQAVRLVTGGIMEQGGRKLVKPYGWTDGMVGKALRDVDEARVSSLTGGAAVRWGDKELQPAELARLMPGAQLGPSPQPGAYTVSIGGRMVMAQDGRPLIVPLEQR